jgi:hypothetical protein
MLLTLDLLEVELNQVNINRFQQLKQYENQKTQNLDYITMPSFLWQYKLTYAI